MKLQTLALKLRELQDENCVVTFCDGDSYDIKGLDIQGEFEGEYEIRVDFDKCLRDSKALREALAAGDLKLPRVGWTSTKPHTPVSKTYLIQEIESVFHRTDNYHLYHRAG